MFWGSLEQVDKSLPILGFMMSDAMSLTKNLEVAVLGCCKAFLKGWKFGYREVFENSAPSVVQDNDGEASR